MHFYSAIQFTTEEAKKKKSTNMVLLMTMGNKIHRHWKGTISYNSPLNLEHRYQASPACLAWHQVKNEILLSWACQSIDPWMETGNDNMSKWNILVVEVTINFNMLGPLMEHKVCSNMIWLLGWPIL